MDIFSINTRDLITAADISDACGFSAANVYRYFFR